VISDCSLLTGCLQVSIADDISALDRQFISVFAEMSRL